MCYALSRDDGEARSGGCGRSHTQGPHVVGEKAKQQPDQQEFGRMARLGARLEQVVHPESGQAADDHDPWQIPFGNAVEVGHRLVERCVEILAARLLCSISSFPRQKRSARPRASPNLRTTCSNVATRLSVMPKISKNPIQNGLACEASSCASAHSFEKAMARSRISLQESGMET
jgi:hypothetical protein